MSDPPPGLVLITNSTCRDGGEPAIGPGLNAAPASAAGLAAGEAATGLAAGEAAAGLAAGEAAAGLAAGLLSVGLAAAGAEVGVGPAGFGGAAPGAQADPRMDTTTRRASLCQMWNRFIATRDLLQCKRQPAQFKLGDLR